MLSVVDGTALQTCAPRCKAKTLVDAKTQWNAHATITNPTDGTEVGHGAQNYTGANVDHTGKADWLVGVGGDIPLDDPLLDAFPW